MCKLVLRVGEAELLPFPSYPPVWQANPGPVNTGAGTVSSSAGGQ